LLKKDEMRKFYLLFLVCIGLLSYSESISAQSFLKKISKGLESVEKGIDKLGKAIGVEDNQAGQSEENIQTAEEEQKTTNNQSPNNLDNTTHNINGKVKEITETNTWSGKTTKNTFRFNEKGQLTNLDLTSYNGNVSVKINYEYDQAGKLIKRTFERTVIKDDQSMLGAPNEINGITINEEPSDMELSLSTQSGNDNEVGVFHYENGKISKEEYSYKGVGISGTTEIFFGNNGKVTKRLDKANNDITEYIYDKNGKLISQTMNGEKMDLYEDEYDDSGDDFVEPTKKYDTQKRLILIDGDNGTTKYTYNQNNFLSQVLTSDRWWGDASTTYTGYEYDTHKNWIKRSMKKTGDYYGKNGLAVSTSRQIIYY